MPKPVIQLCGDPTVDWMMVDSGIDPGTGPYFWMPDEQASPIGLSSQAGGVALSTEFIKTLFPDATIQGIELNQKLLDEPGAVINRSLTVWRRQGKPFSGYRIKSWQSNFPGTWKSAQPAPCEANLLIIEDSNLGFRECEAEWPEALRSQPWEPQNVIVKLSLLPGDANNPVLKRLVERGLAPRTSILTSGNDIRALAVRIPESLSWERTLQQIVAAVRSNVCPFLDNGTLAFARVIVTIGAAGVVIVTPAEVTLVFDRSGQEGDFQRPFPGEMMGYNTAILGSLVSESIRQPTNPNWSEATRKGVELARLLHIWGYEVDGGRLRFPAKMLAKALNEGIEAIMDPHDKDTDKKKLLNKCTNLGIFTRQCEFPDRRWTILEESLQAGSQQNHLRSDQINAIRRRAREIAVEGPEAALEKVPVETIGKWKSADRHEIEGVRSVKNAIREYLESRDTKPLAVAVFGPPGSGKSFAVKQVATDLGIGEADMLTFNLSQCESPAELAAAFQQIQDLRLQGRVPLVFWDEFDTHCEGRRLGWLRYFLAPIQDAQFLDRGRLHPTGGGIYVFAGGTCSKFEQFAIVASDEERTAKKPDFISRLRASIDIRGPNGDPYLSEDDLHVIRRASLLHSLLKKCHPHLEKKDKFLIGEGVLNAFLHTVRYRHGARSMETIISMCRLKGKKAFEQSSLPPAPLLDMHVDAWDFLSLTEGKGEGMLRVGITGHIHLDPDRMDALDKGIEAAVAMIQAEFPSRHLTAFSPMAVGADRMVARKILEQPGARLIAVLPMPPDEYEKDFSVADDRQEFRHWLATKAIETVIMLPTPTRNESYEKAGHYIAGHCDVMIAVWDGEKSQGRGGTAEIVEHALRLRRPVYHIWAGNHKPEPAKRTDVGGLHGKVELLKK